MHGWKGDEGQVSIPPGPLRPTVGAEHISAGIIFSLAFSSIFQLPMESQQAPGKLALLAPIPRVLLFLQTQPSCKPAWLKFCPEPAWGSSGTKFACSVSLKPLGQPRSPGQFLPVLVREKPLLHKELSKKCAKNGEEEERECTELVGARRAYSLQLGTNQGARSTRVSSTGTNHSLLPFAVERSVSSVSSLGTA